MIITTPCGPLQLQSDGLALLGASLHLEIPHAETPITRAAARQLAEYFAGNRQIFDLPIAPAGTPFQKRVWAALCRIPFGQTRTYAHIAAEIGSAPRAVGGACGANPILIAIPCHRVVAADGGLGGFSAGLENKAWLLDFERRMLAPAGKNR